MKTIDTSSYFRFESTPTEQGTYYRLLIRDPVFAEPGYHFVGCTVPKEHPGDLAEVQRETFEACWLKAFIYFAKTHGNDLIHTCDACDSLYMMAAKAHVCETTPNEETEEADPPSAETQ